MRYILIDIYRWSGKRKLLCLQELEFAQAMKNLRRHHTVREVSKPPAPRTVRRWKAAGRCKAICGLCWVPYGVGKRCEAHGAMSWLTALIGLEM